MTYFDEYKNRFGPSNNTTGKSIRLQTSNFVSNTFKNSPDYTEVYIDGVLFDARILEGKDDLKREIRLMPGSTLNKGSIVSHGSEKWIVYDVSQNETFPGGKLLLCNQVLKFKDSSGNDQSYLCHATFKNPDSENVGFQQTGNIMTQPSGSLQVFVKYDGNTSNIKSGYRLILSGKAYKVTIPDNITHVINGVGMLRLYMELTEINGDDNISQGTASNNKPSGNGGKPW